MTYSLDIVNLAIYKHLNGVKKSQIAKELELTVNTLDRWFFIYETNISNKTLVTVEEYNDKMKKGDSKAS